MAGEDRYVFTNLVEEQTVNIKMNGDYSQIPTFFKIDPPAQGFFAIHLFLVQIRTSGKLRADQFGDLPELTNGVEVGLYDADDVLKTDFTGNGAIKNNADWARYAFEVENSLNDPGSDQFLQVRWNFNLAGQPLYIDKNNSFRVKLNDDFTGLVDASSQAQGFFCVASKSKIAEHFRFR